MTTTHTASVHSTFLALLGCLAMSAQAHAQCDVEVPAPEAVIDSYFGGSVSLDGMTLVVGAPLADPHGNDAGSAYFFSGTLLDWGTGQEVTPIDAAPGQYFGNDVAVSGEFALIGAVGDASAGPDSGAVYVFRKQPSGWEETTKLVAADAGQGDQFGIAVAVAGDVALVGARRASGGAGAVYAYTYSGGAWLQTQKFSGQDSEAGDQFGRDVALSDGYAIIGAPNDDDAGSESGSAYIFHLVSGSWSEVDKLLPGDPEPFNSFGECVAIDGGIAVACTWRDAQFRGASYVFEYSGGQWEAVQKLVASNPEIGSEFGRSASTHEGKIAIGARFGGLPAEPSGAVYLFEKRGSWVEALTLQGTGHQPNDDMGLAVDLMGDTIVAGAPQADVDQYDEGVVVAFNASTIDCNGNGERDCQDVASGQSRDDNEDWQPDECESLGGEYCPSTPNSSGASASTHGIGSSVISDDDLTLVALGLPTGEYGYFLMSATQGFVPHFGGSDGNLCLGGKIYRFNVPPAGKVLNSDVEGVFAFKPNLAGLPQGVVFMPGETWNFQSWFRDVFSSNTSSGLSIMFQ